MTRSAAILGASTDRRKFGNKAVRAFVNQGFHVYPVNPTAPVIEDLPAFSSLDAVPATQIDVISIYLPSHISLPLLDDIARKRPQEVWFNPGADAPEVVDKATSLGLPVRVGCSIIAIGEVPDGE